MSETLGTAVLDLTVDDSRLDAGLRSAEAKTQRWGQATGLVATAATGALVAGAAAVVGGFGAAVASAAGFEKTMSGVKAVSGATADEMKGLSALALQLGKDTSFSASEAAAGIEELVKGGLSVPDIMSGAAKATLNLAAAGGVSLPDAATIAANALAQFNLKGEDMAHVADLIAGAANASALDVQQFKFSLQAAGAVAATVGFSFDDLAQGIAVMGKAGITGSDAGTSLKTMMLNLQPSTKKASGVMRDLGIITEDGANRFFTAEGRVRSLAEVAGILQEATKGLTEAQRIQALETIFGSDAIRAAAVLAKEGVPGFEAMAASMGKVTAASVGAERLNNLGGSIEQLKGSAETAAITLGLAFLPLVRGAVDAVTAALNRLIPILEVVAPRIAAAIEGIGPALAAVFATLAPLFDAIAAGAARLAQEFGKLVRFDPAAWAAPWTNAGRVVEAALGAVKLVVAGAVAVVQDLWARHGEFLIAKAEQVWSILETLFALRVQVVVGVVTTALSALQESWAAHGASITANTERVWEAIQTVVVAVIEAVVPFVQEQLGVVVAWVDENWPLIELTIRTVMERIVAVVDVLLQQLIAFWTAYGGDITAITQSVWEIVKTVISTALQVILGVVKIAMQLLVGDWEGAWNTAQTILETVWKAINKILDEALKILLRLLSVAWRQVEEDATAAWNAIKGAILGIWDQIVAGVKQRLNQIIDAVNRVVEAWNTIHLKIAGFDVELPSVNVPGVGRVGGGRLAWPGIDIETPDVPLIPTFHDGGVVPGRPGEEVLALLEAGERVVPADRAQTTPLIGSLTYVAQREARGEEDVRDLVEGMTFRHSLGLGLA